MTKHCFLESLKEQLSFMKPEDAEETLNYYAEMIDDRVEDGCEEEKAVGQIESPEVIAEHLRKMMNADERENAKPCQKSAVQADWRMCSETRTADEIHEIELNAFNLPIRIVRGEQDITLTYFSSDEMPYTANVENGKLTLVAPTHGQPKQTFGGFFGRLSGLLSGHSAYRGSTDGIYVKLAVPDSFIGGISANGTNGRIHVSDLHCRADIKIRTTNARMTAEDCDANQLSLTTSNARVMLENVRAQGEVRVKSTNGRIEAKDVIAPSLLALETSNGAVRAEDCASDEINIRTSNASVSGRLSGSMTDYDIESHTVNAENKLGTHPRRDAPKRLRVSTANARIHFEFTE